ncbi:MAG: hypothetical protein KJ963_06135 [Bacteroidetes bacterium]|nr:hypothetical protein [Bacteroidota bacterium]MBU1423254.1 hypothetical protein [Bacteroidota bacterium]MBU2636647.1 hypothetical protein [Bacteroidota bacterium]
MHHSKRHQYQYIVCPAFHPKFFDQKGCYRYIRVDEDIRTKIDICMQNPPVVGLKAISNVALTAAKNNVKDQVRFIKSFIPNFNPDNIGVNPSS